jgi:hypothetical protein
MFGVQSDRFDHQVELVGAVDLARYAIHLIRRDELGVGEVVHPALSGMTLTEATSNASGD